MLALVLLLSTIVTNAIPAFTMNYAVLPVVLSGENIDSANLRASKFDAIVRDGIDALLPFAEGRTERREAREGVASVQPCERMFAHGADATPGQVR